MKQDWKNLVFQQWRKEKMIFKTVFGMDNVEMNQFFEFSDTCYNLRGAQ